MFPYPSPFRARLAAHPKTTIGVIVLAAALIALGSVMLGVGGPADTVSLLASLFTNSRERIFFVGSSYDVPAGELLRLAWEREGIRDAGTFRFTYPCVKGIKFSFPDGTAIPCDVGAVIALASPLEVVPALDAALPITIFVSIGFIPEGTTDATVIGSTTVTLNPKSPPPIVQNPPEATPTPAPSKSRTATLTPGERKVATYEFPAGSTTTTTFVVPPSPTPNGIADLAANVIATGTVDSSGNAFVPASTVQKGQQAAIVFDASNRGTGTSAPWNFVVNLPTSEPYLFRSGTQAALLPGEKIRFTIGFSDIRSGTTTAVITIDPDNALKDANRDNDHASATFYRVPD